MVDRRQQANLVPVELRIGDGAGGHLLASGEMPTEAVHWLSRFSLHPVPARFGPFVIVADGAVVKAGETVPDEPVVAEAGSAQRSQDARLATLQVEVARELARLHQLRAEHEALAPRLAQEAARVAAEVKRLDDDLAAYRGHVLQAKTAATDDLVAHTGRLAAMQETVDNAFANALASTEAQRAKFDLSERAAATVAVERKTEAVVQTNSMLMLMRNIEEAGLNSLVATPAARAKTASQIFATNASEFLFKEPAEGEVSGVEKVFDGAARLFTIFTGRKPTPPTE